MTNSDTNSFTMQQSESGVADYNVSLTNCDVTWCTCGLLYFMKFSKPLNY